MRLVLKIIGVSLLMSIIGLSFGDLLQEPIAGGITGLIAGIPLACGMPNGPRRWFAMSALIILFGGAYIFGGYDSLLLAVTIAALAIFMMAGVTRELYEGSEWTALKASLLMLIERYRGFQIIDDGTTIVPANASGPLLGPRFLIVRPYNACILQRGSEQTEYIGPSTRQTRPFEYVAYIFNLNPEQRHLQLQDALTNDGAEVEVYYEAAMGIDIEDEKRRGDEKFEDTDIQALQALRSRYVNWEEHAIAVIESCLRAELYSYDLNRALSSQGYTYITDAVIKNARAKLDPDKIKVYSLVVRNIIPKTQVRSALGAVWQEGQRSTFEVQRAQDRYDILSVIADAYARAATMGIDNETIRKELLRQTLEDTIRENPEVMKLGEDVQILVSDLLKWLR